jgi:hypothetical protein
VRSRPDRQISYEAGLDLLQPSALESDSLLESAQSNSGGFTCLDRGGDASRQSYRWFFGGELFQQGGAGLERFPDRGQILSGRGGKQLLGDLFEHDHNWF